MAVDHLPTQWEPGPIHPRLPIGIGVLSIVIAVLGVLLVVAGSLYLLSVVFGTFVPPSLMIFSTIDPLGAGILIVLGATTLAVANALWDQQTWALWTMVVLVFLTLTYLFFTESITVLFVVFLVLFVYLLTVRRYFY